MHYALATLLDPRFKTWYFQDKDKCEEALNFLKDPLKREVKYSNKELVTSPPNSEPLAEPTADDSDDQFSIEAMMIKTSA